MMSCALRAQDDYQQSYYEPVVGEPFFLLADKSFDAAEPAVVRLEVTSQSGGMEQVARYGGVDVVLYRVPKPIEFLKSQRNLHRIQVQGKPAEEGLANTLSHLWDSWYKASRIAWQRIFTPEARKAVVSQAPELKGSSALKARTEFRAVAQFKPIPGFELIDRFRYPVHRAAPIAAPKGVALAGSSSEFIAPSAGNVMIPLGALKPGLYLVEAYVGGYRATTLVFVSSAVAIIKSSAEEVVVWAARRSTGVAVPNVEIAWTDGTGVLKSGVTDAQGIARLSHTSPERSYVLGSDPDGGAFISENFYYDSEIYDAKLYAVTDRPLYRPGDQVFVKFVGREFLSARKSRPIQSADVSLTVFDPNGAPVATQTFRIQPDTGGDTSFRLPENATAGGYELRFAYHDAQYSAAFRVAEYQKPHFEITLVPDKPEFKTKEPIAGKLQLAYPDGKPVTNAEVQLTVRAQQLTMLDGELRYYGQFPVKVDAETLHTDARGEARFSLPAAEEPSRYVLTVFATDGAAYRVKTTRELLIERGRNAYTLKAEHQFSAPNEKVVFAIQSVGEGGDNAATWEWIRLEDRQRSSGRIAAPDRLELTFGASGSYTVQLRDARGNLAGATSHWVSGGGMRAPTGSIEIVLEKQKFLPGETAQALITFPEPVDEALLTLERDRVERTALLGAARDWIEVKRIAPTQWQARLPVPVDYAPNITFSVAYVKHGDYVFQNQGLQVAQPRVDIALAADKSVYAPGEKVELDVQTNVDGKPAAAVVALGVVDEMIYVLQPEIAPDIYDFFYHPRRNNVRTASSLNFISYDLAVNRSKGAPSAGEVNQRGVKVLERPRRDEVDTALWQPLVRTDASGRAHVSFVMPDALTRWRMTARAFTEDGTVGQRTAYVRSDKELYVKWTSPSWMRQGDAPVASIAAFNQTNRQQKVEMAVSGPGIDHTDEVTLKPGANYVAIQLAGLTGDAAITLALRREGKVVDFLETRFARVPPQWPSPRTLAVPVTGARTAIALPPDARNVRVTLASSSAAQFSRVIDDLLEYPYGCIEQTASRMIPFSLAIRALGPDQQALADRLRQQLHGQRLRLAYMAGPKATFAWWGPFTTTDPLLTAYAYYADWVSTRTLGVDMPPEHWNRLLDVYSTGGAQLPFGQRALALFWMQEMGLPVKDLIDGYLRDLQKAPLGLAPEKLVRIPATMSPLIGAPGGPHARAIALALGDRMARRDKIPLPAPLAGQLDAAYGVLRASGLPAGEALMMLNGRIPTAEAERVLGAVRAEMPTLERAMTLAWTEQALGPRSAGKTSAPALSAPWQKTVTASGGAVWRWPAGKPLPAELQLAQAPGAGLTALVQFESSAKEDARLQIGIERRFHRVVKRESGFALEPLPAGAALATDQLYLDEIVVRPTGPQYRYVLLEAPLPPGASVESTTWGIQVAGPNGELQALERTRHEPTRYGYVVPIETLGEPVALRHLVRFAQKGRFVLPAARAYRMYQPDFKAFDAAGERRVDVH